jgi:hypothetical protein
MLRNELAGFLRTFVRGGMTQYVERGICSRGLQYTFLLTLYHIIDL